MKTFLSAIALLVFAGCAGADTVNVHSVQILAGGRHFEACLAHTGNFGASEDYGAGCVDMGPDDYLGVALDGVLLLSCDIEPCDVATVLEDFLP